MFFVLYIFSFVISFRVLCSIYIYVCFPIERVCVGRSLSVAEVAGVAAPPDAAGHAGLLDGLHTKIIRRIFYKQIADFQVK